MKITALVKWYEDGKISQSKAAEVAGISRQEFLEHLYENKVTPYQLMVISLVERSVRKQMAEESIDKLPILPQKMKTGSPTWNNLQYLFRNVHLSQFFVKDELVNQTIKGLQAIHLEVLRLLKVPASLYTNHFCQV